MSRVSRGGAMASSMSRNSRHGSPACDTCSPCAGTGREAASRGHGPQNTSCDRHGLPGRDRSAHASAVARPRCRRGRRRRWSRRSPGTGRGRRLLGAVPQIHGGVLRAGGGSRDHRSQAGGQERDRPGPARSAGHPATGRHRGLEPVDARPLSRLRRGGVRRLPGDDLPLSTRAGGGTAAGTGVRAFRGRSRHPAGLGGLSAGGPPTRCRHGAGSACGTDRSVRAVPGR